MNSRLQKICFTLLILAHASAEAIVNLDSLHFDDTSKLHSGNVSLGFSGASGNTKLSQIDFGTQYKLSTESYQNILLGNYQRGESNGELNTNKRFLHLRHIHTTQSKNRSWEIYTQVESNAFTKLSLRSLLGGGLRYELHVNGRNRHFFGIGGFYSHETLEGDLGSSRNNRANIYLLSKLSANDTSTLNNTVYYQPDIESASDFRAISVTTLKVKLGTQFNLKINLQITHDSRPPGIIKDTDTNYSTAFEYSF